MKIVVEVEWKKQTSREWRMGGEEGEGAISYILGRADWHISSAFLTHSRPAFYVLFIVSRFQTGHLLPNVFLPLLASSYM